mgnify:CR=1 FL=1
MLFGPKIELMLLEAERAQLPVRFLSPRSAPKNFACWLAPLERGNDASPLCRVSIPEEGEILLTGDMSYRAETWFLRNLQPFPEARWLKVAHHGSHSSSSIDFLRASKAKEAWISVGNRNRYKHPTEAALSRLKDAGMKIRRTDREGHISVFPWKRILSYFAWPAFTEEIARVAGPESRPYPGIPATANRL